MIGIIPIGRGSAGQCFEDRIMNEYKLSDITTGMEESFDVTVTDKMMEAFREITGDTNPLHTDPKFAAESGNKDRVCYGLLTSSFLSTLAGVYLPGRYSLIRSVEVKFVKPVYPGDELTIKGTVTEVNTDFSFFDMKVEIRNAEGEKVLRGKMQVGVTDMA